MIYRSRSLYSRSTGGFMRFQSADKHTVQGYGEDDCIRLRDEFGRTWVGSATREDDNQIRYRFRDTTGRYITGLSDASGVVLRDERGKTWRGFVD